MTHRLAKFTRIVTGAVLGLFLLLHLTNHALGNLGLNAMHSGSEVVEAVFENPFTEWVLPTALLLHLLCALEALLTRYSFVSLTRYQWLQYGSGLALPLLLAGHLSVTALGNDFIGSEVGFSFLLLRLWGQGGTAIVMSLMMVLAVTHGGLGLWAYLNAQQGFARWRLALLLVLMILPLLAFTGAQAGHQEAQFKATLDPAWGQQVDAKALPMPLAVWGEAVQSLYLSLLGGYLALVLGILLLRQIALGLRAKVAEIAVTYPNGKKVMIQPGQSLLEASNLAQIPHAQLCQGKGRCSTCRVYVTQGAENLLPPDADETKTLQRFNAEGNIRLACQAVPQGPVRVDLLIPAEVNAVEGVDKIQRFVGQEREVVVLFADIRGFTSMSEHRLPYDVVYILNQYFRAVGKAIEGQGGYLDKFIGDGAMAVFGINETPAQAAKQALRCARDMRKNIDEANRLLEHDIESPLSIGIGLHAGRAIVGEMGYKGALHLTAIGDTVNTASRLESMTKELGCPLVASRQVMDLADFKEVVYRVDLCLIRGRQQEMELCLIHDPTQIPG